MIFCIIQKSNHREFWWWSLHLLMVDFMFLMLLVASAAAVVVNINSTFSAWVGSTDLNLRENASVWRRKLTLDNDIFFFYLEELFDCSGISLFALCKFLFSICLPFIFFVCFFWMHFEITFFEEVVGVWDGHLPVTLSAKHFIWSSYNQM